MTNFTFYITFEKNILKNAVHETFFSSHIKDAQNHDKMAESTRMHDVYCHEHSLQNIDADYRPTVFTLN